MRWSRRMSGYGNCGIRTANDRPRRTQPPAAAQHVGHVSAAARRLVQQLLRHAVADEAWRALRLVLRVVPPARPPQAGSGALGAGAGAVGRVLKATTHCVVLR